MRNQVKKGKLPSVKQPYQKPILVAHGDLQRLTTKGGSKSDGATTRV